MEIGIPIIGCPDYKTLMLYRTEKSKIPFASPYIPNSLLALIEKQDPVNNAKSFVGKKILVLSGGSDELVPWSASQAFVDGLQSEVKEVIVASGIKHQVTDDMLVQTARFIVEHT